MPESPSSPRPHISEDLDFEHRWWRWQRVGWGIIGALLLAALLGLFGPGLLGEATAGVKESPLWVTYQRFGRMQSESTNAIRIHISPDAQGPSDNLRVWLARDYLDSFEVRDVQPKPERVELRSDRLVYSFRVGELTRPAIITFQLEPGHAGRLRAGIGLLDGPELHFTQVVYP